MLCSLSDCDNEITGRQKNAIFCSPRCANLASGRRRDKAPNDVRAAYVRDFYQRPDKLALFILKSARERSRRRGIRFALTVTDIIVPTHCPVLGMELSRSTDGRAKDHSPSLDRITPSLGYIRGNIRVISNRANTLKRDASLDELEKLVSYLKDNHG